MCFFIDKRYRDPSTAKVDIKCWKVMKRVKDNQAQSILTEYVYSFGEVNPIVDLVVFPYEVGGEDCSNIEEGYHSYNTLKAAIAEMETCNQHLLGTYNVYECIIPEGSTYYRSDEFFEYVSNQLIVKSKVKL